MSRLRRRPSRPVVARLTMLGILVVGVIAVALRSAGDEQTTTNAAAVSPAATVREFLRTAFVERDAVGACEFLTPAARTRMGGKRSCDGALARLARQVRPRRYTIAGRGRRVVVGGFGHRVVFHLRPLPASRRPEALAPASGWRIASGVERLVL